MFKIVIFSFILIGCVGNRGEYFILSTSSEPIQTYKKDITIGVEKVRIPNYLNKRLLTIATSSSQIIQIDSAIWAEDLDDGLTQRVIGFLQKKFKQPKVYPYPWGVDRQPKIKVTVQIHRFIAQDDKVYLDANWEITNLQTRVSKAYLFNRSISIINRDNKSIVDGMNLLFGEFEESIAQKI